MRKGTIKRRVQTLNFRVTANFKEINFMLQRRGVCKKHKIQKEGKRCQKMFQLGFWIGDQLGRDVYLENRHMVTDVEVVHRDMFLNMYTFPYLIAPLTY